MEIKFDLKKRIIELQEAYHYNNVELARHAKLKVSTINSYFARQDSDLRFETVKSIAEGFSLTLSQFFAETGETSELTDPEKAIINDFRDLPEEKREVAALVIKNLK